MSAVCRERGSPTADPGDRLRAPEGAEVIRDKLAAWERFIHADDDLDPLVRMAVAHYQFEAIHPFHDGNGRTGRVLNILMLIEAGLLDEPILYLSRSIIARKNDYYRLLRAVTAEGAWIEWIHYMLDVVRESAESAVRKISAIRDCQEVIATALGPRPRVVVTHSSSTSCSNSRTAGSAASSAAATSRDRPPRYGSMPSSRPASSSM